MSEGSLLTPELEALVGTASAWRQVMVTADLVERAVAVHGRGTGCVFAPGDAVPGIVLLGLSRRDVSLPLPHEARQSSQLTDELSFERPLRLGDVLQRRTQILGLRERMGGRFGHHLQSHEALEFIDEGGTLVARRAFTWGHHDPAVADEDVPYEPPPPGARVTPAPLPVEPVRGAVREGDAMPEIVFRPSLLDSLHACALSWEFFDPHFYDASVVRRMPRALTPGPLRMAYLYRALEEWLGDRGTIRQLRNAHRAPVMQGTRAIVTGSVTHLREEAGRRYADIAIGLINGVGETTDRGSAVVELREGY